MNNQKQFFSIISLACDLLGKSPDQVLEQCTDFTPHLLTKDALQGTTGFFGDPILGEQRRQWADAFDLPRPSEAFESVLSRFDAHAGFNCGFELQNYQASSYVGINFVSNTAVECVISLGMPANLEEYSTDLQVANVFLISLEKLYLNGRIQEESEPGIVVCTWKKDEATLVSFVSSPACGGSSDSGGLLSVQIRDVQLHPQGAYFELLYDQAPRTVKTLKLP